jgi:hypothetical protein
MEVKMAAVYILQKYRFDVCDKTQVRYKEERLYAARIRHHLVQH